MTTKYIQKGDVIDYTNDSGADVSSGDVVVMGGTLGVAIADIPNTTPNTVGAVAIEGVFELPKVAAAVIAQGEGVIWDVSATGFDDSLATPATGDVSGAAIAVADAGNGETTVKVKLGQSAGTVA